jgi:hypothetical protein
LGRAVHFYTFSLATEETVFQASDGSFSKSGLHQCVSSQLHFFKHIQSNPFALSELFDQTNSRKVLLGFFQEILTIERIKILAIYPGVFMPTADNACPA